MGNHIKIDLGRWRTELVLVIEKLLEDKALDGGEEYEYVPVKMWNPYLILLPIWKNLHSAVASLEGNVKHSH